MYLLPQFKPGYEKRIYDLVDNQDMKALIEVLENEENLNTQDSAYLQTKGKQGGTWIW